MQIKLNIKLERDDGYDFFEIIIRPCEFPIKQHEFGFIPQSNCSFFGNSFYIRIPQSVYTKITSLSINDETLHIALKDRNNEYYKFHLASSLSLKINNIIEHFFIDCNRKLSEFYNRNIDEQIFNKNHIPYEKHNNLIKVCFAHNIWAFLDNLSCIFDYWMRHK